MDAQRFDRLAAALAGSRSRRGVIATAAAGFLVSAIGRSPAAAQNDCPAGYAFCDGQCRFLENDYHHCGACGNRCTTGPCENGVCVSTADCDEGFTECMGQCVDLQTSVYHCGACGNACMGEPPEGQSSVGVCVDGGCEIVCLEGYTVCGADPVDYCADLANDPENCGACGNVCVEGVCTDGECRAGQVPIEGGAGDALGFALIVERTSLAILRQGLAAFASDAFGDYPRDTRTRLGVMRDHDKEHVSTISAMLEAIGEALPSGETPAFTFAGVEAFLETLRKAKKLATATYAHLLASPTSGEPIRDLAGVAIVEGRHAAWLAVRTGEIAFTEPVERILTREELEAELAELLG